MNNRSLLLAGLLSLGVASMAEAAQYVYMSGSTAARAAFYTAIIDGTTVFDAAPTVITQGNSVRSAATYMNFVGTLGGVPTIMKCHWSGSEGGIADLVGSVTEPFLDDSAVDSLSSSSPGPFVTSTVDLAAADNNVVYSRSPGVAATGTEVCIIAFKWEKEKGSAASLSNVTDQAIRAALAGGAKLAQFTGNPADTNWVYITGRNNQSGTRVNELGDSGYGIFTAPYQLEVNANGSMIVQADGNVVEDVGFSSGGSIATQMGYDLSQSSAVDIVNGNGTQPYSVVAYLGIADAINAEAVGATPLTCNGVAYSVAAVQQGQYNLWGNEYVYHKNTVSSQALTVFNKLAAPAGVSGHADGTLTISLSSMHAVRNGPTSDPSHL